MRPATYRVVFFTRTAKYINNDVMVNHAYIKRAYKYMTNVYCSSVQLQATWYGMWLKAWKKC